MKQLITINKDQNGTKTVNARDLHAFLEIGKDFSTWIKDRINKYDFIEGEDFTLTLPKTREQVSHGGHNAKNYHISLDMAKELSMVERNTKGKEARKYFIACEKKMLAPTKQLTRKEILMMAIEAEEKVEALALENKKLIRSKGQIADKQTASALGKASGAVRRIKSLERRLEPLEAFDRYVRQNTPSKKFKTVTEIGAAIGRSGTAINKILTEIGFQEASKDKESSVVFNSTEFTERQVRVITEAGEEFSSYVVHRTGNGTTRSIKWNLSVLKQIISHLNKV